MAKVLEATAHVLSDVGPEAASTNKIARRAGVSVGSIYQYFPNKAALFEALIEQRIGLLEQLAAARMRELHDDSYASAAEAMLRATVDFYASQPGVTPLLAARSDSALTAHTYLESENRVHAMARAYLASSASELAVDDLDLTATISISVVGHFAPLIAMSEPSSSRERYIAEIVAMLAAWVSAKG